jgi:hypothetical protein
MTGALPVTSRPFDPVTGRIFCSSGRGCIKDHVCLVVDMEQANDRCHGEGRRSLTVSIRWVLQSTLDLAQIGERKGKKLP